MTTAIHCTISYYGPDEDDRGMPIPWFHYLVVASPGVKPGYGTASILSLSEAKASGIAQGPLKSLVSKQGGPQGALQMAKEFLAEEHTGLQSISTCP